jgi:hypothetical protein
MSLLCLLSSFDCGARRRRGNKILGLTIFVVVTHLVFDELWSFDSGFEADLWDFLIVWLETCTILTFSYVDVGIEVVVSRGLGSVLCVVVVVDTWKMWKFDVDVSGRVFLDWSVTLCKLADA